MTEYDILMKEAAQVWEDIDGTDFEGTWLHNLVRHAFNVGLNEGLDCIYDSEKRAMYLIDNEKEVTDEQR